MAQKIEDLTESKNFFAELFQIISRFVLAKKNFGVRYTSSRMIHARLQERKIFLRFEINVK